jgi:SNF2 family DNA or RNA helicase
LFITQGVLFLLLNEQDNIKLPPFLEQEAHPFFKSTIIYAAFQMLAKSQVKIDYVRGSKEKSYFIASGSVFENREHLINLKFKKPDLLTSSCDCLLWNKSDHCVHVAAIFLKYHSINRDGASDLNLRDQLHLETGARPKEYGTIIQKASQLSQVALNLDFMSCQYQLNNRKVINFPLESTFTHQLILNLIPSYKLYYDQLPNPEELGINSQLVDVRFLLKKSDQEPVREINLFEHTHLFNWNTGELWRLPNELRDFIRKIRYKEIEFTVDDYLRLSGSLRKNHLIEIYVEGQDLMNMPVHQIQTRMSIIPHQSKTQLQILIDFHAEISDNTENLTFDSSNLSPIPSTLKTFIYDGGYLSTFKKKLDGAGLLQVILDNLNGVPIDPSPFTRLSNEKEILKDLISSFLSDEDEYVFDPIKKSLNQFSKNFLKILISSIYTDFGPQFFRFSAINSQSNTLSFFIPTQIFFDGLSQFYAKLIPFGLKIFYDKAEISKWSSRIHFERRKSQLNWFELELNLTASDLEIIKNANLDNNFVITNNGLILLTNEQKNLVRFMKRYTAEDGVTELKKGEMSQFVFPLNRARIFELFELRKIGIDGALTPEEIALCEKLANFQEMPEYPLPEFINNTPRPYQITGYHWLRFLHEHQLGACLADDMGLGKTLQTILFLQAIYPTVNKILIVCPVSIIINWEMEFQKFSNIPVHIYYGGTRDYNSQAKIIITSYGIMKKEFDQAFANEVFDVLILDEVQHLKNLRSMGASAARNIKSKFRICLTGTPVENDLSEFYNILDLSLPGIWGSLQFLKSNSSKKSRLMAKQTAKPFILRRTKAQVLSDLPAKLENHVYLNFSEGEEEQYKRSLLKVRAKIDNIIPRKRYGEILKGLLELRQLCLWQKTPDFSSTKISFLLENIEQILEEGHQAIIFSQFTTYLDFIQKEFEKKTWKFSRIDGTKSFKQRQKDVDAFQEGKNPLFLISLKAGGVGLNLTAASYVFLMDPWWNPAVEAQAIDRAHRIGQTNKLTVYRPIIKNSVEEKVLKLQEYKRELFNDLLSDSDDSYFTGKLTIADFEKLFS